MARLVDMADLDKNPPVGSENAWERFSKNLTEELRLKVEKMTDFEFVDWAKENQDVFPEARFPHLLLDARFESRFIPKAKTEEKVEEKPEKERAHRRRHRELELIEEKKEKEVDSEQSESELTEPEDNKTNETESQQAKTETDWVRDGDRPQIQTETERVLKRAPAQSSLPSTPTQVATPPTPARPSLRSRIFSTLTRRQDNLSSASVRIARSNIIRPVSKTPGLLSRLLFKGGTKGTVRAGLMASRILTQLTALVVGILSFKLILVGLLIILVIVFLLVFLNILVGGSLFPTGPNTSQPIESPYPGISYSVTPLDRTARIGSEYRHAVKLFYTQEATCSIEGITLVDLIPPESTLVESKTTGKFTRNNDQIRWKLHPDNVPLDESGSNRAYYFEAVFVTNKGIDAQNRVYIEGCGDPIIPELKAINSTTPSPEDLSGLFAGADSLPTTDTCNKYGGIMEEIQDNYPAMDGTNFGDPLCNYSDAKFRQVLEQTEKNAANIPFWLDIVSCESRSPNGFGMNSKGGTWGRFQMRAGYSNQVPNPGKKWTELGDRGDVPWQRQIQNAVYWNNQRAKDGNNFIYWESAYCLCSTARHKDKPYCDDINRQGKAKTCSICR